MDSGCDSGIRHFLIEVTINNTYAPSGVAPSSVRIKKLMEGTSGQAHSAAGFTFELYDENRELVAVTDHTSAAGEALVVFVNTYTEPEPSEPTEPTGPTDPSKPPDTTKPTEPGGEPETGDDAGLEFYLMALLAILILMVLLQFMAEEKKPLFDKRCPPHPTTARPPKWTGCIRNEVPMSTIYPAKPLFG